MDKNKVTAINLLMIVTGMGMLAYASPTIYKTFCAVTGFGGTTQVAQELPTDIRDRTVKIRFNSDIDPTLGWDFEADQLETSVHIGENGLAFFTVKSEADEAVKGMATYNVTPLKAGKYFNKVYCFCFDEQEIKAGETIQYPVSFFIDPRFDDDSYMDDVDTITLSYTFYRLKEED